MYSWRFRCLTIERGWVATLVKASDKQEAIKKGFAWFDKKGLSYALNFECKLLTR